MISILISIFNHDPSALVKGLSSQGQKLDQPYEIIVGNDCSESKFMPVFDQLDKLAGVRCFHSVHNIGRSRIRNTLASMAKYSYLLFIDGDAEVFSEDFIQQYLNASESGLVLCGGTAYWDIAPIDKDKVLRWKYGLKREARTAEQRNIKAYSSFSSFNFLIPADIFGKNLFDENIIRYGHEDTIFGIELEKNNIRINHIDNQMIHTGLDSAVHFLEKTREGILNLVEIENSYYDKEALYRHIRLLKKYNSIRRYRLHSFLSLINWLAGKSIKRNLTGSSPSLRLFDLYKLCLINDIKG